MDFSIVGVMSWLLEKKVVVDAVSNELAASNLLTVCYVLLSIRLKRSCFLVAFLFIEMFGYFVIPSDIKEYELYSYYIIIYSICYWLALAVNLKLKTMNACVIMIAFQLTMTLDAAIYPKSETFLYLHYEYFFVFIHLCFICSFNDWSLTWSGLVDRTNRFFNLFSYNYNFTLLLL